MIAELNGVNKTYAHNGSTVHALRNVSLAIDPGEFVVIRGPSGCGKTSLLMTLGGLLRPEAGQVTVDGKSIYSLSPNARAELRASTIGFVFQQFHLVPYLSVLDNVLSATIGLPTNNTEDPMQRAAKLLDQLRLTERAGHVPAKLSTGERQRTALARALMNSPAMILADEPTGNLDDESAEQAMHELVKFSRDGGAVLLVTHDRRTDAASKEHRMENGVLFD